MSVYDFKPKFQGFLRPISSGFARHGVSANMVTFSAILLSGVTGAIIMRYHALQGILFLMPAVLLVRMALNAIDGMMAREHDMKSALGAVLNELGDVVSDALLYIPLCFIFPKATSLILLFIWMSALSEMAGIMGVQIGASRRYDGPMGKSDRAVIVGILCFVAGFVVLPDYVVLPLFALLNLGLVFTILRRSTRAIKEANHG